MAEYLKSISLPNYSRQEEQFNTISHFIGLVFSLLGTYLLMEAAYENGHELRSLTGFVIYCFTLVFTFCASMAYHAVHDPQTKKILRIFDHCNVYFLISGTYTPYLMSRVYDYNSTAALRMFAALWGITAVCVVLTFVSMGRFKVFLNCCYVVLGVLIAAGFVLFGKLFHERCLALAAAAGAVILAGLMMYALGSRKKWFHSIFHVLVMLCCTLFYLSIYYHVV
ncbi:MAG: hemolysin III family protein [Clostridiales bacterium]|nr:hemolysin III family protein [Clostridiales bacterium]